LLNDRDTFWVVLDHPELPLTNNAAERALRHRVIARRISYETRNRQGSRAFTLLGRSEFVFHLRPEGVVGCGIRHADQPSGVVFYGTPAAERHFAKDGWTQFMLLLIGRRPVVPFSRLPESL
jgi:hypothetical protein